MTLKIIAIIQARMTSSRLPGKVLLDIAGQPMLVHVVERTRRAQLVDQVMVATTIDSTDDPIHTLCLERGYPVYRGSLYDVLDRYYQAAQAFQADVIVRITADCPLIDPGVVDQTICKFLGISNCRFEDAGLYSNELGIKALVPDSQLAVPYDFAANRLPPPWGRTYPVGLDTEICTFQALELAWQEAQLPYQREHVMPFFYDQPERFRILHVNYETDYSKLRWTVDTPEDLELVRNIFSRFPAGQRFNWLDVISLVAREPQLAVINQSIQPKDYREFDARGKD
jgi:spore coat polysaccharide biosynthesis protein SpsF